MKNVFRIPRFIGSASGRDCLMSVTVLLVLKMGVKTAIDMGGSSIFISGRMNAKRTDVTFPLQGDVALRLM